MKKNEIISEIIKRLDNGNGTYSAVDITKIIPAVKRMNARFNFVIAKTLSVGHELDGTETLRFCTSNAVSWRCPDLTKKEYEAILESIPAKGVKDVYVIFVEETVDYESNARMVCATTDRKKATNQLKIWKERVRQHAKENGYVFDETNDGAESYNDGYAAEDHLYVTMHISKLD